MPDLGRCTGLAVAALLTAGLLVSGNVRGDDLTTLSGQTFHNVQPVRVEPDGVTWRHAEGVAKVDFSDSPDKVRAAYHYDAAKAAAYHEARAQAQRQAAGQARQLLQAHDERRRAGAQLQPQTRAEPAGSPGPSGTTVTYRHGLAPAVEAAARSLGEQAAARDAKIAAAASNSEGLGNPRLWSMIPGQGSEPKPQHVDLPNSLEFKLGGPSKTLVPDFSASQGPAGAFAEDSAQDPFFRPIYMTKSYNEDIDRAAAFARGTPLK